MGVCIGNSGGDVGSDAGGTDGGRGGGGHGDEGGGGECVQVRSLRFLYSGIRIQNICIYLHLTVFISVFMYIVIGMI